jgi:hypothetical protein
MLTTETLARSRTAMPCPVQRLMIDVPLFGWREVEIRWLADNRAGCRFVMPLREEELRAALCRSDVLAACFPGLPGGSSSSPMARA